MKLRILPLLIIFLGIIIVVKFADLLTDGKFSHHNFLAYSAFAEEESSENGEGGGAKQPEKPKKPDMTNPSLYKSSDEKPACAIDLIKEEQYTPAEVEMLKKLSERRKELDKLKEILSDKDNLLKLTESKIDNKIKGMTKLKSEITTLVNQYRQNEDQKIDSLVKIYSNMKPKEAARIFEELDLETLLQVINRMKETKSAPILAQMNPVKAKDLTLEIANHRKLKLGCACPVDANTPIN